MTQSNIRNKRLERGWTLAQLADECTKAGTPTAVNNLSRIESGKQVPRPKLRSVLARILELDINDFDREAS